MTPEQFCYWLQGCAETRDDPPDENQWDTIKHHLNTVFEKVTPPAVMKTKAKLLAEEIERMNPQHMNPFDPTTRIC